MSTTGARVTTQAPQGRRKIVSIHIYADNCVRVCRKAPINNYKVRWYYNISDALIRRLEQHRPPLVKHAGQPSRV